MQGCRVVASIVKAMSCERPIRVRVMVRLRVRVWVRCGLGVKAMSCERPAGSIRGGLVFARWIDCLRKLP